MMFVRVVSMTPDEYIRLIKRGMLNDYPLAGTRQEKLDSVFVDDLKASSGISVFRVGGAITEKRIVVSVAAGRNKPGHVDYVVFGMGAEFVAIQRDGDTPDAGVNRMHFDVYNADDDEIINFADNVAGAERKRLTKDEVVAEIRNSIRNGYMDKSDINFDIDDYG